MPERITITLDGETITTLDIPNGSDLCGLCAVVSPTDYEGEIVWTSEDSGIVKISAEGGTECILSAKKTGSTRITAECGGLSTSIRVHVLKDQNNLSAREIALTVNGSAYSAEMCNIYFASIYYSIISTYGDSLMEYGLDISAGMEGLEKQECSFSSDGTWYGFFLDEATGQISQMQALCDYAESIGLTLSDEDYASVEQQMAAHESTAADSGYTAVDDYFAELYGTGVTTDLYREYLEDNTLAGKAYDAFYAGLNYSEEEISAHYAEMGYEDGENDYPVTSMRHILVMAEADGNGEYSDTAIASAHKKAEQLYEEWASGEKTESSFAALADTYSDDSGSVGSGGLYEDIYNGQMVNGINEWLFSQNRDVGDTAVIDNNGSYVGTHIVYFVGYGDLYSSVLSLDDLKNTDLSEWLETLTADSTIKQGSDYTSIGKF